MLAAYLWNIRLCESLYPVLHLLEVGLRNRLHGALTHACGRPDWYDGRPAVLESRESAAVADAKAYIANRGKVADPCRVVAELNFGFWISLFNARYHRLWPRIAERSLPHMPRRDRTRSNALGRFGPLRDLRNRVFHHARVVQRPLDSLHATAYEAIGWLGPQLVHLGRSIDRFPAVFAGGPERCRRDLMAFSHEDDYVI